MKRVIKLILCLSGGLILLGWGLLTPSHMRAVDAKVLEKMREGGESLVAAGLTEVSLEQIGPARELLAVARRESVPDREKLESAVESFVASNPELLPWGGADPYLEQVFPDTAEGARGPNQPVVRHFLKAGARQRLLEFLRGSRRPGVQEILGNRLLRDTTHFPPVASASGQPLEAAIVLTGLLFQGDHLAPPLRDAIGERAAAANRGGDSEPIEQIYLDLMSLGMRLDWVQLTAFVDQIKEINTLRNLTYLLRRSGEDRPVIFAAVHLSRQPEAVSRFLMTYGDTGVDDLSYGLRSGRTGVKELLGRQQPVWHPTIRQDLLKRDPFYSAFMPLLQLAASSRAAALVLKYFMLAAGAFLIAASVRHIPRRIDPIEQRLRVSGFDTRRQAVFAFCLVLILIVFAEPFLAQESQELKYPVRLRFPGPSEALLAQVTNPLNSSIMNQITILSVVVFLVVQIVFYTLCLIKLAEIRRQEIPSDLKLRLLDNEENLFDAGLYIGLTGTVVSLVFLAIGIIEPSLMAAYSSTLFGIVFVALFKIAHLRPTRRRLIMESSGQTGEDARVENPFA